MKTIETKLISVLQEYFGYSEFRDTQKDIMLSVLSGRDTLAVIVEFALPAAKQAGVKIEEDPDVAAAKLADWIANTAKAEIKK